MRQPSDVVTIIADVTNHPVPIGVARLLVGDGGTASAATAAHALGLPSRFALARRLRRVGALPFVELREWIVIERALRAFESDGTTPCAAFLKHHKDPAGFYRLVRRLTGHSWCEVCELGSTWLLARFAERCRAHHVGTLGEDQARSREAGGLKSVVGPSGRERGSDT